MLKVSFDEARVDFVFDEEVMREYFQAGRDCCFDWLDYEFA